MFFFFWTYFLFITTVSGGLPQFTQFALTKTCSNLKQYHNHDELTKCAFNLQRMYPDMVSVYSIGKSVEERDLWVTRISKQVKYSNGYRQKSQHLKPWFKIVANTHGNEAVGRELSIALAYHLLKQYRNPKKKSTNNRIRQLLDNIDLHILHSMNPDGFEKSSEGECVGTVGRNNSNNEDLNRNFPTYSNLVDAKNHKALFRGKEPETKAMMSWTMKNPFVLSMSFHDGYRVAAYPYDTHDANPKINAPEGVNATTPDHETMVHLAQTYANLNPSYLKKSEDCKTLKIDQYPGGIKNGADWFVIPGGMQDFNYLFSNGIELTFEMSCCKYPKVEKLKEEWDNNHQSILAFMEMVHMGIKGIVTNRTNGKPIRGALIHVRDIKHPVSTTKYGEYWKILMPGTHVIHASFKDPKTGKTLRSTFKKVKIPESEAGQQKTAAIRFDFEL